MTLGLYAGTEALIYMPFWVADAKLAVEDALLGLIVHNHLGVDKKTVSGSDVNHSMILTVQIYLRLAFVAVDLVV